SKHYRNGQVNMGSCLYKKLRDSPVTFAIVATLRRCRLAPTTNSRIGRPLGRALARQSGFAVLASKSLVSNCDKRSKPAPGRTSDPGAGKAESSKVSGIASFRVRGLWCGAYRKRLRHGSRGP